LRSWLSEAEALKLVHELEVHQIELDLQNQELLLAIELAEIASVKHTELFDFAPLGYFTLDLEGKILELNLLGSKLLGKERSHLIKGSFGVFVSDDTKKTFRLFLNNVFNGKIKESCEITLASNGNSPTHVLVSGILVENGRSAFITAVDITTQKLAYDALHRSEARLGKIIANIGDGLVVFDKDEIITYASPDIERLFGWKQEEVVGKRASDTLHPELQEATNRFLSSPIRRGKSKTTKNRCRCKDGSVIWIELTLVNLSHDPDIRGFLGKYHKIGKQPRGKAVD
jgi:PAS domain S-box-containing protein